MFVDRLPNCVDTVASGTAVVILGARVARELDAILRIDGKGRPRWQPGQNSDVSVPGDNHRFRTSCGDRPQSMCVTWEGTFTLV